MPTLLHINSSPLYGRSVSRELTAAFVTEWKASHGDGRIIERDLNATPIPPVNAAWVGAAYTPDETRTPQAARDSFALGHPACRAGAGRGVCLWRPDAQLRRALRAQAVDRPDLPRGQDLRLRGWSAQRPASWEKGYLPGRDGRYLRPTNADGLVQLRRAVPKVRLWLPWREGCDLPHRGRHQGP